PGPGDRLVRIDVPPLTRSELGRLFVRLPQLRDLTPEQRQVITRTIGGHPRLIEFVDALLRQGRSNLKDVADKLRDLAWHEEIDLNAQRDVEQAVDAAVLLGSRNIVLGMLVDLLDGEQRELLLQAAVSTIPLSPDDLSYARYGRAVEGPQRDAALRAVARLVALTLLSPALGE